MIFKEITGSGRDDGGMTGRVFCEEYEDGRAGQEMAGMMRGGDEKADRS
jgi:hypothetical protein